MRNTPSTASAGPAKMIPCRTCRSRPASTRGARASGVLGSATGRGWLLKEEKEGGAETTPPSVWSYPPEKAFFALVWKFASFDFMLLGLCRIPCRVEPHSSPSEPGSWSEPSKRNTFAVFTCAASLRTSGFGYAPPPTCLFGEMIAPVETQMLPAFDEVMYF